MGPDSKNSLLNPLDIVNRGDAFGFQEGYDLVIVNKGPIGEDGPLIFVGFGENHFHGPADTHTKCSGFCKFNLQRASPFTVGTNHSR